jgi:hypothetical protein
MHIYYFFLSMLLSLLTVLHCFSNFQARGRSKMRFKEEYFAYKFETMAPNLQEGESSHNRPCVLGTKYSNNVCICIE